MCMTVKESHASKDVRLVKIKTAAERLFDGKVSHLYIGSVQTKNTCALKTTTQPGPFQHVTRAYDEGHQTEAP